MSINLKSVLTPFESFQQINFSDLILITVISIFFSIAMFCALYFVSFTTLRKFLSFKNINTFKKIIFYQVIGLIISACLIPAYYYVSNNINSHLYLFSMQVIVFMVIGIFLTHWIMVGIFPGFIIANTLYLLNDKSTNLNVENIVYMIIFFILAYLFCFINNFFFLKSKKRKSTIFIVLPIFSLIFFTIIRLLGSLIFREINQIIFSVFSENILINWLLFLVLFAIGSFIQKIFDSTKKLEESILYDNKIFVNNGYSKNAFNNYIRTNKIKTGIFMTFEFECNIDVYAENKQISNLLLEKFRSFLELNFKSKNKNDSFFFKTKWNEYGMFFKINKESLNLKISCENNFKKSRSELDFFKNLEILFNEHCCKESIFYKDKIYNFKPICFISIYGIHSSSFDELVSINQKLKNNWFYSNFINTLKIYDYNNLKEKVDKIDFLKFKEEFNLHKSYVNLNKAELKEINTSKSKTFITQGVVWIDKNINKFEDIYLEINKIGDLSLVIRNFSLRALKLAKNEIQKNKKLKNYFLVVDYPVYDLSLEDFEVNKIIEKVDNLKIDKNKLILNFNFLKFNINDIETFFTNLKLFQKKQIKISFSNIDKIFFNNKKIYEIILKPNKIFSPDLVFIKNQTLKNESIKKLLSNIPTYEID